MRKLSKQYFDIVESSREVVISPRAYAQMAGESATMEEQKAIKLIEDKWCEGDGNSNELTLTIKSLGGWSGPEMRSLEIVSARLREVTELSGRLIEQVAEALGCDIKEAAKFVTMMETQGLTEETRQFLPLIMDINQKQGEIDPGLLQETALIKRTIPTWNNQLTLALHQEIRIQLNELADLEASGGFEQPPLEPVEAEKPNPLPISGAPSISSETTPALIGAA
jgi:hypothetical protein